jgi:hypothetical protein
LYHPDVGRRVRLIRRGTPHLSVKPGDTGTIWRVTEFGIRRIAWDNGYSLDLDPEKDEWEVLPNGG